MIHLASDADVLLHMTFCFGAATAGEAVAGQLPNAALFHPGGGRPTSFTVIDTKQRKYAIVLLYVLLHSRSTKPCVVARSSSCSLP